MIDYKVVEEREADGVFYQRVRFYEGAVTTEDELNVRTGLYEPVTRYRRHSIIEEREYEYEAY